jgi:peptidoglycan/LPS O-acetylase OafA/YrhL
MDETRFLLAAGLVVIAAFVSASLCAGALARMGLAPAPARDRNAAIDGLRGYLALAVLAHHFLIWLGLIQFGRGWRAPAFFPFNHLGLGAVALFFMITGYVFQPWIAKGEITGWPRLAVRRLFRLQPLVLLSVALVVALCFARGGSVGAGQLRAVLIWLSCWSEPDLFGIAETGRINAYVLWSLKFEWLFTLFLLPICALAARALRGRAPLWLAPGALLLLVCGANFVAPGEGVLAPLAMLAPLFLIGMIAHEVLARERVRVWFAGRWRLPLASLGLIFAMARAPTPFPPMQMALYGLFFCCIAARRDLRLLTGLAAQALGAWAYPIYLLHGLFFSLLFVEGGGLVASAPPVVALALLPVAACVVVGTAALVHVVIERPMADFGRRLTERRQTAKTVVDRPLPSRRAFRRSSG